MELPTVPGEVRYAFAALPFAASFLFSLCYLILFLLNYNPKIVQDLPSPFPFDLPMVLIKPREACSTAEVYKVRTS